MITRAKPLLGTVATIQVDGAAEDPQIEAAVAAAFAVMARVSAVMSAHDPHSDLGRMGRASCGQRLMLDPHTVVVLRAAQYWRRKSAGAFNPVRAARALVCKGVRPGLPAQDPLGAGLEAVDIVSETQVQMLAPVPIDLGGIAKGYAVDRAIEVLAEQGITHAIVNAGGDMRVLGALGFAVDVRHARTHLREHSVNAVRRLRQAALATSVSDRQQTDFVQTAQTRRAAWRSATVLAPDCMTADVLTKWALQAGLLCPELKTVMREHHARMWRS